MADIMAGDAYDTELDVEFIAGFRIGWRAGYIDAQKEMNGGVLPEAAIRALAGHGAHAGWAPAHPH